MQPTSSAHEGRAASDVPWGVSGQPRSALAALNVTVGSLDEPWGLLRAGVGFALIEPLEDESGFRFDMLVGAGAALNRSNDAMPYVDVGARLGYEGHMGGDVVLSLAYDATVGKDWHTIVDTDLNGGILSNDALRPASMSAPSSISNTLNVSVGLRKGPRFKLGLTQGWFIGDVVSQLDEGDSFGIQDYLFVGYSVGTAWHF